MAPCHQDLVFPILVPGFAVASASIYLGMPMMVPIYTEPSDSNIHSFMWREGGVLLLVLILREKHTFF